MRFIQVLPDSPDAEHIIHPASLASRPDLSSLHRNAPSASQGRSAIQPPQAATLCFAAMGTAIGTICPDSADPDPATLTPEISLRPSGGQIGVRRNKGGQEGVGIQKDSGNGQWIFLALDTRPNYIDTTPMPATSAKWKYRAIYSNDAQRIGQWSNVAEITVGG